MQRQSRMWLRMLEKLEDQLAVYYSSPIAYNADASTTYRILNKRLQQELQQLESMRQEYMSNVYDVLDTLEELNTFAIYSRINENGTLEQALNNLNL